MNYLATTWGYHHYFADKGWTSAIIVVTLLLLAFEIWMIVDVFNNKNVPKDHKIWWLIGMLIFHPFVAIVYFLLTRLGSVYRK